MLKFKDNLLESGGYATKQIFSKSFFLKLSHQARFKKAYKLISKLKPSSIVDYGCGDATFLIFVRNLVETKNGIEIDSTQLGLLRKRFLDQKDFNFFHSLDQIDQKFSLVTCFEVLEHCTEDIVEQVLCKLQSLCEDDGRIIISVPNEIGASLLFKQLIRRFLSFRKYGSYEHSEWYSTMNLYKSFIAGENQHIKRNYYSVQYENTSYTTCGHYGFNWKSLHQKLRKKFIIEKIDYSPKLLPFGIFSSQIWFTCRLK